MSTLNLRSMAMVAVMTMAGSGVLTGPVAAQERPAPVVALAVGTFLFPDDGITVKERFGGGAGRFYVSPRVSVGPEIAFIGGDNHSHLMLTGNLTFDVLGPRNGHPRRVTPFVVVGGGLFRTRDAFPGLQDFTSTEGGFTMGGGLRATVGRRVTVGAEARIGAELHMRVNGILGIHLGSE